MDFKSLSELELYLQKKIAESLQIDVAADSRFLMMEKIQTDVYEAYSPSDYIRTWETIASVETTSVGSDAIELKNTREGDYGENIPQILEYGKNYSWGKNLDARIGPRPFFANTYKDLASGKAISFMKKALMKRGIHTI